MTDGLKDVHREAIIAVIAANDGVERAVLFGSRATGTNTVTSDVDIALFGDRLTLTHRARLTAALEEIPMAQTVDLLLYDSIQDRALREHIRNDGVEWYPRATHQWRQGVYGRVPVEYVEEPLENLCVPERGIQTGPFGSQLHKRDYVSDGTPIVTVEHLGDNRLVHRDLPRVSDKDRDRLSKYRLKAGDIVFSRVGSVDRRARNLPTTLRHVTSQCSEPSFPSPSRPSAACLLPSTALTGSGRLIQTSAESTAARGGPATKRSGRAA